MLAPWRSRFGRLALALAFTAIACGHDEPIGRQFMPDDGGEPDAGDARLDHRDGGPSAGTGGSGGRAPDRDADPRDGGPEVEAGGTGGGEDGGEECPDPPGPPVGPGTCGDGFRDPAIEECDDGNASDGDLCSSACRVVDALLVPPAALGQEEIPRARRLGAGRHVVAPACEGFAAVFASDDSVELAAFDRAGLLKQRVANLSGGSLPASAFDPVVAALPGGRYAVAWNDFGGDGSERGIALVAIDPAGPAPAEPMFANSGRAFSQYDPDILRAGGEVVVAWTDDASIATGTDVRFRRFSRDLVPLGDDEALAETEARESAVVLAEFGSSWAAAWRALGTTGEITRVRAGGVEWEVGPHAASPAGEKPALVAIDEQRLILAFSSQNAIDVAVLDTAAPGTSASVAVPPLVSGSASEPLLARTGEHVYLAWRSGAVPGDSDAEELWLKQITFTVNDGTTTLDLSREEIPLPRTAAHQHGDQRAAALTVVGRGSDTAIAALWEDYGRGFGPGQAGPDVAIELAPIPFLRLPANGSPLE